LEDRETVTRFQSRTTDFSLPRFVHTDAGVQPAPHSMGKGGCLPWDTAAGSDADHSHVPSVDVKNGWSYFSTVPYAIISCKQRIPLYHSI